MLLPMVSRPFAFLERRGQRALLEIARAFQSAPGSFGISTCTLMRSASRPGEFVSSTLPAAVDIVSPKITRLRTSGGGSKFSMPFALMAGQVGTPNSRAALSAVSMPGALFVPLADKYVRWIVTAFPAASVTIASIAGCN